MLKRRLEARLKTKKLHRNQYCCLKTIAIMQLMKTSSAINAGKSLLVDGRLEAMHLEYIQERVMLTERRYRGEMKESLSEDCSHQLKRDTDRSTGQGLPLTGSRSESSRGNSGNNSKITLTSLHLVTLQEPTKIMSHLFLYESVLLLIVIIYQFVCQ